MPRFLIFADGLPATAERRTLVRDVATEDCHSTRGYSIATSDLSAEALAKQMSDAAVRRGAKEGDFRVVVLRYDQVSTRGFPTDEDCF